MTKVLMEKQVELEFREDFLVSMKRNQCFENNRIKAYELGKMRKRNEDKD